MNEEFDIDGEIRKLKLLRAHRLTNELHRYYTPIGKVEDFIEGIASGKYVVGLLSAANSIGKTYAGANMLANLFWPVGNKFFQQDMMLNFPFPKRGRIISDPTTVTKTIIPTLKKVFPAGRYTTKKNGKQFESTWITDTGWEFDIMTYEQDIKEFESATLGFIWCDEPPPEAIYKASIARFRLGGVMWITATPLTGSAWMYDEIITNVNNEAGYRFFIEAEVEDACEEHGVRGFLKHEHIMKQVSQYSAEDRQARIFGKFQHLTGLVFKNWRRDIHLKRAFKLNPDDYSVIELFDYHPRNPDAVLWVATDKYSRKFVVDEIFDNFSSVKDLAIAIKRIARQYRIVGRYADPSAWNTDQHREGNPDIKSIADELNDELEGEDVLYVPASKQRTMGIKMVYGALDYQLVSDEVGSRFVKEPELFVFDNCIRTIFEFEHWQYNEWTGKTADKKNRSEKPQDKDDHMMENTGRSFLNDPGFVPNIVIPKSMPYSPLSDNSYSRADSSLDPFS